MPTRGSTGFAATLARATVNEPALPEQIFAPFAEAIVAPAAAVPANRARFPIDPPHEAHHDVAPAVQPPPLPTAAVADAQPASPPPNRHWPMPSSKPRRRPPWPRPRC